jgi:iron complex transport system ATP-binding protein
MVSLVLAGVWALAVILSLNIGSVPIPVRTSLSLLADRLAGVSSGDPLEAVLFSVRLPRVLLGSLVGAALAAAGTAFQSLLRNPLADPYVLGVSTGASLGTIIYSIVIAGTGFATMGGGLAFGRPLAAFLGAAFTVGAVYLTASGGRKAADNSQRLLLAGIVLASFLSSINVFLLTSINQADLRGIFYWLIGDLSRQVDASIYPVTALVFAGVGILYIFSHSLNLIATGEEDALILGVEVKRVKTAVYIIASLITGAVVSISGPIAYIGLICPHRLPLRRDLHPAGRHPGPDHPLPGRTPGGDRHRAVRSPALHLSPASQGEGQMSGDFILEARNLDFDYRKPIVRDISFGLRPGTFTGIVGPNGCGKTTVLRLLDGIIRPLAGEVLVDGGRPLSRMRRREIARLIAMVPQNGGLDPYQTVLQFAMLGRAPYLSRFGFENQKDEAVTLEALEMTQMTRYLHARVTEISGGEKQRLLLARALAQRTPILLLDEVTANLDINYQVELMRLVRRITREQNLATLVVSHEINILGAFCDRIILMSGGRIRFQGSVGETLTREHLKQIFGLDFSIRRLPGAGVEVLPVIHEETSHVSE